MKEEKDISLILYEDWQYLCCGEPFELEDYVCWSVRHSKDKNSKYDYLYEGCPGGTGDIIGKVKKMLLVNYYNNSENNEYEYIMDLQNSYEFGKLGRELLITLEKTIYKEYDENYSGYRNTNTVVVIGDIKGIGGKISAEFKKNNINIVIVDSNKDDLIEAKKELKNIKGFSKVEYFACDINIPNSVSELVEHAYTCFNNVGIWINLSQQKISEKVLKNIIYNRKKGTLYDIVDEDNNSQIIVNTVGSEIENITLTEFLKIIGDKKNDTSNTTYEEYKILNNSTEWISKFLVEKVLEKISSKK